MSPFSDKVPKSHLIYQVEKNLTLKININAADTISSGNTIYTGSGSGLRSNQKRTAETLLAYSEVQNDNNGTQRGNGIKETTTNVTNGNNSHIALTGQDQYDSGILISNFSIPQVPNSSESSNSIYNFYPKQVPIPSKHELLNSGSKHINQTQNHEKGVATETPKSNQEPNTTESINETRTVSVDSGIEQTMSIQYASTSEDLSLKCTEQITDDDNSIDCNLKSKFDNGDKTSSTKEHNASLFGGTSQIDSGISSMPQINEPSIIGDKSMLTTDDLYQQSVISLKTDIETVLKSENASNNLSTTDTSIGTSQSILKDQSIGILNPPSITDEAKAILKEFRFGAQEVSKLYCKLHKYDCEYYCDKCNMPICSTCLTKSHQGHTINELPMLTKDWLKHMSVLETTLEQCMRKSTAFQRQLREFRRARTPHKFQTRADIERQADDMHKRIEKQKQYYISELEKQYKAQCKKQEITDKVLKYEVECIKQIQRLNQAINQDIKHRDCNLAINYKNIELRIETINSEIKPIEDIISDLQKVITFNANTDLNKELSIGKISYDPIKIQELELNHQTCLALGFGYSQLLWTKTQIPPNPVPYGCLFLNDDSLLVAYDQRQEVTKYKIYSHNNIYRGDADIRFRNNLTLTHSNSDMLMPRCMTKLDHATFAVTDARYMTVRYFKNDGLPHHTSKHEIFKAAKPDSPTLPFGIATLPNQNLAISDKMHNRVYILDPKTEKILTHFGTGSNGLKYPEYLSFDDTHKRILVTDSGNNAIKVYDINGKYLSQFGHSRQNNQSIVETIYSWDDFQGLQDPGATVCMPNGNILVANGYHHNIYEFDVAGNFMSIVKLYQNEKPVKLAWPRGIAFGSKGQLAITEVSLGDIKVVQFHT